MPRNRKLGRPTDHRIAMLRGMVTLLLEKGSIETRLTLLLPAVKLLLTSQRTM